MHAQGRDGFGVFGTLADRLSYVVDRSKSPEGVCDVRTQKMLNSMMVAQNVANHHHGVWTKGFKKFLGGFMALTQRFFDEQWKIVFPCLLGQLYVRGRWCDDGNGVQGFRLKHLTE